MEGLQNRIDSFSKSKRVKNPNKPSSNITLKWPHPSSFSANPDTLAEAGFFYNPSPEDPDNVTCFLCDKQLSDWEAEDDPFDIHYEKCAHKCSWANIRCGLRHDMDRHGRFIFLDKARIPTSKAMEKARLETFTAWVHDKTRGHGASSKKLAKAGFVCTHNSPDDDLVMCFYCNVSLSGWDKDDDPMEEHRKRKDKSDYPCPFFPESTPLDANQHSKPSSSRSASNSKQHQDLVMPTKVHDRDSDGQDENLNTKTPAKKSRPASGSSRKSTAKTPRAKNASKSSLKEVIEVEEEVEEPAAAVKKPRRATSKARARSAAPEMSEDIEEPPATVKKKRTRTKSVVKLVASEAEANDEPPDAPPTTKKKKATRSRSEYVAPSEKAEQSDQDAEPPVVEEAAKKPSRSKGKARVPIRPETDEEAEEEPVPRKSSRSKSKAAFPTTMKKGSSKSKSKPRTTVPDAEPTPEEDVYPETAEDAQEAPKPRNARKPRPTSSKVIKSKAVSRAEESEVSQDEFGPVIEQPHFAAATAVKSRSSSRQSSIAKQHPLANTRTLGKGKLPSSRTALTPAPSVQPPSSVDDEDELGGYTSAPSSPPPPPPPVPESSNGDYEDDMEMTPLVIPKQTTKPSAVPPERQGSESSDSLKRVARPKPMRKMLRPSQTGKPAAGKVRASINKMQDTSHMKVVDILSSEDDFDDAMDELSQPEVQSPAVEGPHAEPEELRVDLQAKTKGKGKKGAAQAKKSLMFTTSSPLLDKPATTKKRGHSSLSSAMQLTAPVRSSSQNRLPPQPSNGSSSEQEEGEIEDADVSMQEIPQSETEVQVADGMGDDTKMEDLLPSVPEIPRTPPRPALETPELSIDEAIPSKSQTAPPAPQNGNKDAPQPLVTRDTEPKQSQEAPFFPPLSKLPFVPIAELTEAELDMTVEEWIRYQMEVEYDRFRRDGERELQRFRKRAEEARKVIEGL